MKTIRQIIESISFAYQALKSNILRTTLSLLGVFIGIFSIVAIYTAVDSMNLKIRSNINSFSKEGVIYLGKWPWTFTPNYPWWKYFNRPELNYNEYKFLKENLTSAEGISMINEENNIKFSNGSSYIKANLIGIGMDYIDISTINIIKGRYFLPIENDNGIPVAILGYEIYHNLGLNQDNPNQIIKINGYNYRVIGYMEKVGQDAFNFGDVDNTAYIPYLSFKSHFERFNSDPIIAFLAKDSDNNAEQLESEIIGLMRSKRSLKPKDDDNFSINRLDGLKEALDGIFTIFGIAGTIIAGFSLLVGGFGIANIMFVSVKERTNIIGIQKSLGAKNYFILIQFLTEAIFLSLIGGALGVLVVWLITLIPQDILPLVMTMNNVVKGLAISSIIGALAGIIPAWVAAKMDPVIAIRSK